MIRSWFIIMIVNHDYKKYSSMKILKMFEDTEDEVRASLSLLILVFLESFNSSSFHTLIFIILANFLCLFGSRVFVNPFAIIFSVEQYFN
jgi:hypothetical protein